ncbi:hypothetical protein F4803DRAFT_552913 [Xylaria telfairii]|nr:hypothetical protein F4803DRAFT_552913 [Xylaria telfairii]
MFPTKFLASVFFAANPILAGTPQGYGYGDVTDTIVGASTDSPAYTITPYSVVPVTITNSITLTKPVTVTITHTVTVSRSKCSLETTTVSSTTDTTLTTKISIFIPEGPSYGATTTQATITPGVSAVEISTVTSCSTTAPTTGLVGSETTSCESATTSEDVDGVTGSSLGTPTSISALSIGPDLESSSVRSGASNSTTRTTATRTSSSTVPLSTIATSLSVHGMVDAGLLAGAVGLASLLLTVAI